MASRRSKLQVPRSAGPSLPRPGLVARLVQAVQSHRLLLLQAPAGCGKTRALADLVGQLPAASCAWVNIEPGETWPTLIDAWVAALDPFDLPWRQAPAGLAAQADGGGDPGTVVEPLVRALQDSGRPFGLIVLDDWHHCTDPAAARGMAALLDGLPQGWALALGTRTEPASELGLPRRRVRGEVAGFGRADLAFSAAEVQTWARQAGWHQPSAVQALAQRTQGWPAALGLALAARVAGLAAGPGLTSDESLFEFIATEVVDQLPPALRRFLLRCSVLPELTVSRTAAVSADPEAAAHLQQLRRRELFVSQADERGSLRLHELFRQALRHQLEREEAELLPTLLRRAAAGEADPLQRVRWLLQAADAEAAAAELEAASAALITQGAGARVDAVLQDFDDEAQQVWPLLAIVAARLAWSRWDFGRMLQVLERVPAAQLEAAPAPVQDLVQAYRVVALDSAARDAECARLMATMEPRPLAPLPRLLLRVTQLAPPRDGPDLIRVADCLQETVHLADRIGTADAWYQALPAGNLMLVPGTAATLAQMASAMHQLSADEPTPLRAWAGVLKAWAELGRGDTRACLEALNRAEDDARWNGNLAPVLQEARLLRALLFAAWSRPDPAWRAIEQSIGHLQPQALPEHALRRLKELDFERRARLATVLGDAEALQRLLADSPATAHTPPALQRARQAALGAQAAATQSWSAACHHWGQLLPDLLQLAGRGQAIELHLRLAAALLHEARPDEAARVLRAALDAPQALREPGPALLAGAGVLHSLAEADWQGRLDPPQREVLRAWHEVARRERQRAPDEPGPAETPAAGLSAREREVLERLALGDSNKDIARRFGLSAHTVKRHVANLLDKLDLRSRGQAAAWFHAQATGAGAPGER